MATIALRSSLSLVIVGLFVDDRRSAARRRSSAGSLAVDNMLCVERTEACHEPSRLGPGRRAASRSAAAGAAAAARTGLGSNAAPTAGCHRSRAAAQGSDILAGRHQPTTTPLPPSPALPASPALLPTDRNGGAAARKREGPKSRERELKSAAAGAGWVDEEWGH